MVRKLPIPPECQYCFKMKGECDLSCNEWGNLICKKCSKPIATGLVEVKNGRLISGEAFCLKCAKNMIKERLDEKLTEISRIHAMYKACGYRKVEYEEPELRRRKYARRKKDTARARLASKQRSRKNRDTRITT